LNKKIKQLETAVSSYKEEKENFNKKLEDSKLKYDKAREEVQEVLSELKQVKGI